MPPTAQVNPLLNLFPIFFMIFIFYFLVIRPQKTQEKQRQKMLTELNKNDQVVTTSGIHGVIVNLKDKTLTLRIDENVKIEIERNSVAYVKKE